MYSKNKSLAVPIDSERIVYILCRVMLTHYIDHSGQYMTQTVFKDATTTPGMFCITRQQKRGVPAQWQSGCWYGISWYSELTSNQVITQTENENVHDVNKCNYSALWPKTKLETWTSFCYSHIILMSQNNPNPQTKTIGVYYIIMECYI